MRNAVRNWQLQDRGDEGESTKVQTAPVVIGRASECLAWASCWQKQKERPPNHTNSPLPSPNQEAFPYISFHSAQVTPHPTSLDALPANTAHLAPPQTPPHPSPWLQYVSHFLHRYGHMFSCIITNTTQQAPNQPRPYPGNYLPNGGASGAPSGPAPGAVPLLPNQGRVIQQGSARVLCIADVRGETYLQT